MGTVAGAGAFAAFLSTLGFFSSFLDLESTLTFLSLMAIVIKKSEGEEKSREGGGECVGGRGRDGKGRCSIEILEEYFLARDYVSR